ncbi:hypothetical protein, partial [Erwinia billingiae]
GAGEEFKSVFFTSGA